MSMIYAIYFSFWMYLSCESSSALRVHMYMYVVPKIVQPIQTGKFNPVLKPFSPKFIVSMDNSEMKKMYS